jgi:hypothetical protein
MGKIGEHEKTIIAEPLKEPLPAERKVPKVPAPVKKIETLPAEVELFRKQNK